MNFVWWLDSLRTDLMLQVPGGCLCPHKAKSEVSLDPNMDPNRDPDLDPYMDPELDNDKDLLWADLMLQEAVPVPHEAESEVALDPGLRLPGQGQVQLQQVEVGAVPGMDIINFIITV